MDCIYAVLFFAYFQTGWVTEREPRKRLSSKLPVASSTQDWHDGCHDTAFEAGSVANERDASERSASPVSPAIYFLRS